MNAPTQAISPAYGPPNPYGPSIPPRGMPPSTMPDPTQGDGGSSLAEEAFKQQLAARQTQQQQNPFKQAWENSVNWLKTHWKLALGGVAVLVGGGSLLLMRGNGNNAHLAGNKGNFWKRLSGGWRETTEDRYKRLSTELEKYIQEAQTASGPGKVSAMRQVLKALDEQQGAHVQNAENDSDRCNRQYAWQQLQNIINSLANPLFLKVDKIVQTGREFHEPHFDAEINKILQKINRVDNVWLNNLNFIGGPTPTPNTPTPAPNTPTPTPNTPTPAPNTPTPTPNTPTPAPRTPRTPPAPPTGLGGESKELL